jgi:hypothetical protein
LKSIKSKTTMDKLSTIIVSALIGGAVSAIGALIQSALSARTIIGESIRSDRVTAYKLLWKKTALLPLWPRATDVTYEQLSCFSAELRDWSFNDGGQLFSTRARQEYEALQALLREIIKTGGTAAGQISPEH